MRFQITGNRYRVYFSCKLTMGLVVYAVKSFKVCNVETKNMPTLRAIKYFTIRKSNKFLILFSFYDGDFLKTDKTTG